MLFVKIHTDGGVSLTAEDLNVCVCLRRKRHKAKLARSHCACAPLQRKFKLDLILHYCSAEFEL